MAVTTITKKSSKGLYATILYFAASCRNNSYYAVEWVEVLSSWYNNNIQEAKEREKKVFCQCSFIIYRHSLWSYCAGFGCVSLSGNILLKLFINKTMSFIKFFMIKWILNFGICSPEATLEVQLSKCNDITGNKMMTVFAILSIPLKLPGFLRILLLSFFKILNKAEDLENIAAVPQVSNSSHTQIWQRCRVWFWALGCFSLLHSRQKSPNMLNFSQMNLAWVRQSLRERQRLCKPQLVLAWLVPPQYLASTPKGDHHLVAVCWRGQLKSPASAVSMVSPLGNK